MRISEMFFSIQGEGVSSGVPALFIRVAGCNLMCGGSGGSLVKAGKATWWCDTEETWKQYEEVRFEQLIDGIMGHPWGKGLMRERPRIVWTGGEPAMEQNAPGIMAVIRKLKDFYNPNIFHELETNGTIMRQGFYGKFDQINCSPKLSNSGLSKESRIKPEVLKKIFSLDNSWLKLVVDTAADVEEAIRDIINPLKIPHSRVILMPGVDQRDHMAARTRDVWELALKYNLRMCSRLQVLAFDKTTGV